MADRAFFVDSVPTQDAIDLYDRFLAGETSHAIAASLGLSQGRVFEVASVMRVMHEKLSQERPANGG